MGAKFAKLTPHLRRTKEDASEEADALVEALGEGWNPNVRKIAGFRWYSSAVSGCGRWKVRRLGDKKFVAYFGLSDHPGGFYHSVSDEPLKAVERTKASAIADMSRYLMDIDWDTALDPRGS